MLTLQNLQRSLKKQQWSNLLFCFATRASTLAITELCRTFLARPLISRIFRNQPHRAFYSRSRTILIHHRNRYQLETAEVLASNRKIPYPNRNFPKKLVISWNGLIRSVSFEVRLIRNQLSRMASS